MMRGVDFTQGHLGSHGLPLILRSDWNDHFGMFGREGRGRSKRSINRERSAGRQRRADVVVDKTKGRFTELQSIDMLPPDERTLHLWNENPFRLDGRRTSANWEQPGTFYLLPYWMGRYYGFIVEEQ